MRLCDGCIRMQVRSHIQVATDRMKCSYIKRVVESFYAEGELVLALKVNEMKQ